MRMIPPTLNDSTSIQLASGVFAMLKLKGRRSNPLDSIRLPNILAPDLSVPRSLPITTSCVAAIDPATRSRTIEILDKLTDHSKPALLLCISRNSRSTICFGKRGGYTGPGASRLPVQALVIMIPRIVGLTATEIVYSKCFSCAKGVQGLLQCLRTGGQLCHSDLLSQYIYPTRLQWYCTY